MDDAYVLCWMRAVAMSGARLVAADRLHCAAALNTPEACMIDKLQRNAEVRMDDSNAGDVVCKPQRTLCLSV